MGTKSFSGTQKSGRRIRTLRGPTLLATGCGDGSIWIWDEATGREPVKFDHGSKVNTLAFAPDGQSIASGGEDGMILIWRPTKP